MTPQPANSRDQSLIDFHQTKIFQWELIRDRVVERIERAFSSAGLVQHQLKARVKDQHSFVAKGGKRLPDGSYRYTDPITQIHDLVGIRVVMPLAEDIAPAAAIIQQELHVVEVQERGAEDAAAAPGYQSLHLVGRLRDDDPLIVQYQALAGDVCIEIQVRSILQDAYASFHHDIAYKTEQSVSDRTSRQLKVLAAVLDLADQEFARVRAGAIDDLAELSDAAGPEPSSNYWTSEDLAAAVMAHTGGTAPDPPAWLAELAAVLEALSIHDRASLDDALAGSLPGPHLGLQLRARRPWLRDTQVLDVMLQLALGDRYVDARVSGSAGSDRDAFANALEAERGEVGR